MAEGQPAPVRVVVVSDGDVDTITDCLDGIARQGADRVDVVVVDLDGPRPAADAAIHHPLPRRVAVVAPGSLDRVLTAGVVDAPDDRVVVVGADRRPEAGWLDAALAGLDDHDLVRPPDGDHRHLALRWSRVHHLSLDGGRPDERVCRVRIAGGRAAVVPGMRHVPATPTTPREDLPELDPPAPGARDTSFVTVVLCTRDRPDQLARCLSSLGRLDDHHHEILVVDNNDVPCTDPASLPRSARLVHEPRRGLDHARNRGLAEAAGALVAYVDDDCEVDPHWLSAIRAGFADPAVRVVTGRVRPARLTTPSERWFEAHFSFDRGAIPRRFTPWDRRPWYPMWPGGIGAGCNMAFRREALAEVGGFDELLDMGTSIGGGGDLDLFSRLLDRGALIAYRPDALVWHHHRTTPSESRRQFFGYGVAVGALLTKTALERPGHRYTAVRFFLDRLNVAAHLIKRRRAGASVLPVGMVVLDLVGQIVGPFVYVRARSRAPRT